jgi:hypothetical protein
MRLIPLALLLAVTGALFFGVLRRPAVLTLDMAESRAGSFVDQFESPERGDGRVFRWSTPGSRLLLHGVSGAPQELQMHIHGGERVQQPDRSVRIERDKQPLASFEISKPEWRVYRVLLPAGAAVRGDAGAAPIDLLTSAYFSDLRSLGVPIEWITVAPLAGPGADGVALVRALLLAWGLLGLAGLLWAIEERRKTKDERPKTGDNDGKPFVGRRSSVVGRPRFSSSLWRRLDCCSGPGATRFRWRWPRPRRGCWRLGWPGRWRPGGCRPCAGCLPPIVRATLRLQHGVPMPGCS